MHHNSTPISGELVSLQEFVSQGIKDCGSPPEALSIAGDAPPLHSSHYQSFQLNYTPSKPFPHSRRSIQHTASSCTSRVPRPRNAFMIFRSAFWAEEKIVRTVEHDHRHISRIIGHCWNQMSEPEKDVWRHKADREKVEHEMKYPGYRFCPTSRTKKPIKRKVKRNGAGELLRCKKVAELLLSGKQGNELADAVKNMQPLPEEEVGNHSTSQSADHFRNVEVDRSDRWDDPPFRSPLLPPLSFDEELSVYPTQSSTMHDSSVYDQITCLSEWQAYYAAQTPAISMPTDPTILHTRDMPPLDLTLPNIQEPARLLVESFDLALDDTVAMTQNTLLYNPRFAYSFTDPFSPCGNSLPLDHEAVFSMDPIQQPCVWNSYPFTT